MDVATIGALIPAAEYRDCTYVCDMCVTAQVVSLCHDELMNIIRLTAGWTDLMADSLTARVAITGTKLRHD